MTPILMKERTAPVLIEGLEAAVRRIPRSHPVSPNLQSRLSAAKAGYGGELELDRVLNTYKFPHEILEFHDLSLVSHTLFQMDTLLLTEQFALICEVKNMAGDLVVTENPPQLIRTADDGTLSGFLSPLAQVHTTCKLFEGWLRARGVHLPVYGCVVMAYAKQRITLPNTEIPTLFPKLVPGYVGELMTGSGGLTTDELALLGQRILESHQGFNHKPICERFDVPTEVIKGGVACPDCDRLGMWKRGKGWYCPACKCRSMTAHEQAIRDWFWLTGKPLTNAACRALLGIDCPRTALRLLRAMELTAVGNKRGRTYSMQLHMELAKHT
ncbi:nuclease-related domain-containing protein [Sporosarcina trichiuri]|uniref:nuclease-related domain-containing protein n=1 Tax=Sporosarcina trichiuri TaxID=3056445 RepID=UPI0025B47D6A|nr:nuclease-related domain-containing protein [Sporosarcina sp. 0.2-SM1T-5]WJY26339.1 nuclease-related domain-containing protein [Sporosarcina sp. 0.2-SM1T-5]